jgi:tRNA 2-thiouridine synthesizing protein B
MALTGDEVVLLQNGVFWAVSPEICDLVDRGIKVYVIENDLYARGYSERESFVPLITYDGMIDIIERQEKSLG